MKIAVETKLKAGDIIQLSKYWKKHGYKTAIPAWEEKEPLKLRFNKHHPADSENYAKWFAEISNSTGYILQIDGDWIQIRIFSLYQESPALWMRKEMFSHVPIP